MSQNRTECQAVFTYLFWLLKQVTEFSRDRDLRYQISLGIKCFFPPASKWSINHMTKLINLVYMCIEMNADWQDIPTFAV